MSKLMRGHLLGATSAASTGAIRLASVSGMPETQAIDAVNDAIADLIRAVIVSMEAVGFSADEQQRQHLYRDMLDYVEAPRGGANA